MRRRAQRLGMGLATFAIAASACLAATVSTAWATSWDRLSGGNAYDTMERVVKAGDFSAKTTDTVIVANGDGYWDALAASGLAGRLDAPVLITPTARLSTQTASELKRLAPSRVIVMGGDSAVSDAVLDEIRAICPKVDRISGKTAPDTAVSAWGEGPEWSTTAVVASSTGYWDALSIASYAYAQGAPIFLASGNGTLGEPALEAIRTGGFERVVIAGGDASVSDEVKKQLEGIEVVRLSGPDAIGTSAAIARWAVVQGMTVDGVCVASADGYWDALTGAALAGSNNAILVLARTERYEAIEAALENGRGAAAKQGHVLGGDASVSTTTYDYLKRNAPNKRGELKLTLAIHDSFVHDEKPASRQKYIMLHDTEELLDPLGIVDFWLNHNGGEVATHFVVGRDGSIAQCVPLNRVAYHAGSAPVGYNERFGVGDRTSGSEDYGMNSYSIGIEICHVGTTGTGHDIEPDYPAEQLEALDKLIAYIDAYYGSEAEIIDHKTWTPGNPDCSAEFEPYLANYRSSRTHDGKSTS